MKFYKIDDQVIFSDKSLSVGTELIANTTDGATEKHVPVISTSGNEVKVVVGSVHVPVTVRCEWMKMLKTSFIEEPLCPVAGSECPGKKASEEKEIEYE